MKYTLDGEEILQRIGPNKKSLIVSTGETFEYVTYAIKKVIHSEDINEETYVEMLRSVMTALRITIEGALIAGRYRKNESAEVNISSNPMIVWRQGIRYSMGEDFATALHYGRAQCTIAVIPPQSVNSVTEYLDSLEDEK